METHANYTRIGFFVLFGIVGSIMFILWLSQSSFGRNQFYYNIYFEGSVAGLKNGSSVQYRGVPIGLVKSIQIRSKNLEQIKVTISINQKELIRSDMVASLETQGLTGIAYVQIEGGSSDSPILEDTKGKTYPTIPSKKSLVEELYVTAPMLLRQTNSLINEIKQFFNEENRTSITETIHNIQKITAFLTPTPHSKDSAIQDMKTTMDAFWNTLGEIQGMSKELKDILKENRQGLRNLSTVSLENFNRFFIDGQEAMTSVKKIADALDRSPSRFFYNDPSQGVPTK